MWCNEETVPGSLRGIQASVSEPVTVLPWSPYYYGELSVGTPPGVMVAQAMP